MKRIIMLAGVQGTGKSTYASKLEFVGKQYIISSDEIRYSYTGAYNKLLDNMYIVYDKMIEQCNKIMSEENNVTVILDSTFLTDDRRNYFINKLKNYDCLELHMLRVHDNKIIFERNHSRIKEKWVPEEVIKEMIDKYSYPSDEFIDQYSLIKEVYVDE